MKSQVSTDNGSKGQAAFFIALCLSLTVWLSVTAIQNIPKQKAAVEIVQPDRAIALLKLIKTRGNMLVDCEWGSYVTWNLGPSVKVSMDRRDECVYLPAVRVASHMLFEGGADHWDFLLENFPVDMVLIKTTSPAYSLMKLKPGWKLVYKDDFAALFYPAGSPQVAVVNQVLRSAREIAKVDALSVPNH